MKTRPARDKTPGQEVSAPRTRGWFRPQQPHRPGHQVGPAHAGMVPRSSSTSKPPDCRPRARGDGSQVDKDLFDLYLSAPRTRGWFAARRLDGGGRRVGPAHAGMVPVSPPSTRCPTRRPRARGDGSRGGYVFFGRVTSPRARGDGSHEFERGALNDESAPRTRGWFPAPRGPAGGVGVGPAHAGMVRRPSPSGWTSADRDRARGYGFVFLRSIMFVRRSAPRARVVR